MRTQLFVIIVCIMILSVGFVRAIEFNIDDICVSPGEPAILELEARNVSPDELNRIILEFDYISPITGVSFDRTGLPTEPWFASDWDDAGHVTFTMFSTEVGDNVTSDGTILKINCGVLPCPGGPYNSINVTRIAYELEGGGETVEYSLSGFSNPTISYSSGYSWYIDIDIDACGLSEDINRLGQASDALDGFDETYDEAESPESPPPWLKGYFPHPEWGVEFDDWAYDIRAERDLSNCPEIWYFKVDRSEGCNNGQLTFHFTDVPVEYPIWLIDLYECGQITQITDAEVYNFNFVGSHSADFLIIVGPLKCYQFLAGWNLISVPYIPIDRTPDAIFSDDITPFYLYGGYCCESMGAYNFPTAIDSFAGYWFGLLDNATVCVEGDIITDRPIEKQLCSPGWNLIGNPIPESKSKDDIDFSDGVTIYHGFDEAVAANLLYEPRLLGWYNGGYIESEYLNPWQGYWINVKDNCTMQIPAGKMMTTSPETTEEEFTCTYWRINIRADNGTGAYDYLTTFGVSPDASDEFDSYDYAEPPSGMGNYISVYFPHPEWGVPTGANFDYDIKSPLPCYTEKTWAFSVISSNPNVILSWDPPPDLGCDCEMEDHVWTLYDVEGDEYIDMADGSGSPPYSYPYIQPAGIERHFTINAIACDVKTSGRPNTISLNVNPNPFNSSLDIAYNLTSQCAITLEICDITGHTINTLVNEQQNSGSHTITWATGKETSSGIYFVRLKAGNQTIIKRAILIR